MIEKKRVDIDNMDEFLSIELDNGIYVGNPIVLPSFFECITSPDNL